MIEDRLSGFRDTSCRDFSLEAPPWEASSWAEVRDLYDEGEKGKGRHEAARLVLEEQRFFTPTRSGELYVWDPEAGIYREEGREVLGDLLLRRIGPHHSTHEVRQVLAKVRAKVRSEGLSEDFGEVGVIPVAGADLVVDRSGPEGPRFRPEAPSPERRFAARVQVPWTPEAEAYKFRAFLRRAVPSGQDRQVLQDYAGYSLLHWGRPYRRALLLHGSDGSGVGLLLEILTWLFGRVSQVEPDRLVRSRSRTLPPRTWANVQAAVSPESLAKLPLLSGPLPGRAPSGEHASANMSSGSPQATPHAAKHIYTAEDLPTLATSDAFFRRVLLVSCPEKLPAEERGPKLRRALWAERGEIFQWALEGLRRVLKSLHEGEEFPSGRPAEKTQRRWEALSGPIGRFKETCLEVTGDPDDLVVKQEAYEAYRKFCRQEGVLAGTKDRLTRTLTEDPRIEGRRRVPEMGADQVRCYIGTRLKVSPGHRS